MNDSLLLLGVGAYLLGNVALGVWAGRRVGDSADYIVAGRRLPLWLATATLFATWFGGGTCIGAAGAAYREGLIGTIADPFGAALCLFLAGWFFVRPLRRLGLLTVGDFFRVRFGAGTERISAVLQVPPFVGWVAAQFVAFGTILHALAGVDQSVGIVLGFSVVLIYTVAGGMWAVSITDFLQSTVLIAGLLVLFPLAVSDAGGWAAVAAAAPAGHFDVLPEPDLRSWLWYVQAWLVIGLGSIPSQDLLQRSFSARNETVAARSAHLAGGLYLTIGLIPVLLGILASSTMPGLGDPELALPLLGKRYLGTAGMTLFVGALLSAILSTSDSALLAPASVFTENLVRPLRPGMSDRALLRTTRASVAVFAVVALLLALRFRNVYELMLAAMEAGLAGLVAPFVAGLYWRRADALAANVGMVAGTAAWLALSVAQDEYPADLLGFFVSIAAVVACGLRTGRPAANADPGSMGQARY